MFDPDKVLVVIIGSMIGVLLLLIAYAGFLFSSIVAGHSHQEYRCVNGVVESREVAWGVGIGSFSPIDGDPAGACK